MNTKHYLTSGLLTWFILDPMAATLIVPTTYAQDGRRYERRDDWRGIDSREDRRRLEGTWYLNGEREKPCRILATNDGLEAKNERGETSQIVFDRFGYLRARDWGNGLRGEFRRQSIEWANGTTWTRVASRR